MPAIHPVLAAILAERGVAPEQYEAFLNGNEPLFHDPFLLSGMDRAVARINAAVGKGEQILIVGDSDADGITATAILLYYLRSLGAKVQAHIPAGEDCSRFWSEAADECLSGVSLLITVDCGISLGEDLSAFARRGIDVIVSDHHEYKDVLPQAYAIVDPKGKDETYPFPDLSGAGVALKIAVAMAKQRGNAEEVFFEYCDLACVGTVADAMPLLEENRFIVKAGLSCLSSRRRIGLDALLKSVGYNAERQITASSAGFVIAPRLNAAGRVGESLLAVTLLGTGSAHEAAELSGKLSELNRLRQQAEAVALREATAAAEKQFDPSHDKILILRVEDWPPGIPGIIASRLVDRYAVPCIIVSFRDGVGKGSGRSVKGFDLFAAIRESAPLFTEFGGHELAAGFTVMQENFEPMRRSFVHLARMAYRENGFVGNLPVSAELSPGQITAEFAFLLCGLEPYGIGNPQPLFLTKGLYLSDVMSMANPRHLRLRLSAGGQEFFGLSFGHTQDELHCAPGDTVDVIYALDPLSVHGKKSVQLIVKSILPAKEEEGPGRAEFERFSAGEKAAIPPSEFPEKKDVSDLYGYLMRTAAGGEETSRYADVLARCVSRSFARPFGTAKILLCMQVLKEIGAVECRFAGEMLRWRVLPSKEKKNLSESALWRRLKG